LLTLADKIGLLSVLFNVDSFSYDELPTQVQWV